MSPRWIVMYDESRERKIAIPPALSEVLRQRLPHIEVAVLIDADRAENPHKLFKSIDPMALVKLDLTTDYEGDIHDVHDPRHILPSLSHKVIAT